LKYNANGDLAWRQPLSSTGDEWATGVRSDGAGNAYFTGRTSGQLGSSVFGSDDAFIGKVDSAGNIASVVQFGTAGREWGNDIAIDHSGNALVTGAAWGKFGAFDDQDFFVTKLDSSGNQPWLRYLGTPSSDQANSIALDRFGNVYVVGVTAGQLGDVQLGSTDAFLCKFDSSGNLLWTKQFGTDVREAAWGLATDVLGNIFVGGYSAVPATGTTTHMAAFVTKFDSNGNSVWTYNTKGASSLDIAMDLAADDHGNVFVVGNTGNFADSTHVFVMKLGEVPEPTSLGLLLVGLTAAIPNRRRLPHDRSERVVRRAYLGIPILTSSSLHFKIKRS
jgi:Beta-propeller repeat